MIPVAAVTPTSSRCTPVNCSPTAPAGWATCSRTGSGKQPAAGLLHSCADERGLDEDHGAGKGEGEGQRRDRRCQTAGVGPGGCGGQEPADPREPGRPPWCSGRRSRRAFPRCGRCGQVKPELKIDCDDPAACDGLVSALVNDACAVVAAFGAARLDEPAASALALLALIAGQDVEPAEGSEGLGSLRWLPLLSASLGRLPVSEAIHSFEFTPPRHPINS
jgi:hypothetical protein